MALFGTGAMPSDIIVALCESWLRAKKAKIK